MDIALRQYGMAGWRAAARAQYRHVLAMNPRNAEAAASWRELLDQGQPDSP